MKYLQNYKIAVPVFGVDSTISYQTVRRPTVFEKSLLQLLAKYRNDLGNFSIEQIADEMKASPVFFMDGLRYLMEFNAAQIMDGLSLDEGPTLTLQCFDITADGKKFLADNALPSSNKRTSDRHFYHPISRELVSDKRLPRSPSRDAAAIEENAFNVTNSTVAAIVEENIHTQWQAKPNTRIDSIASQLAESLWDHTSISLDIDGNGNLTIASADKLFRQWLDSADKEYLWDYLLQNCFTSKTDTEIVAFNWRDVNDLATVDDAHRLKRGGLLQITSAKHAKPDEKTPAIYLYVEDRVFLQGNVLVLPESQFPIDRSFYALNIDNNFVSSEVHVGHTDISFGGQPRSVDLTLLLRRSDLWNEIRDYLLTSKDLDVVLFSSVLDVEQAVSRLPLARVQDVHKYYERMKEVVPNLKVDVFLGKIEALKGLSELEQYQVMFSHQSVENKQLLPSCFVELVERSFQERKAIANMEITPVLSEFSRSYFAVQDIAGKSYFDSGNLNVAEVEFRLVESIDSWTTAREKLIKVIPPECLDLPVLKGAEERISQLENHILTSYAPPRNDNRRVIVIDTNCLMHSLHLLKNIKSSDWLVIPRVVLRELDGLKTDKTKDGEFTETATNARKAIDRLRSLKSEHYQKEHLNLLKENKNDSADTQVLSVAAYYRRGKVLLITDDKNLRNMANAENIPIQDVNSYLGKKGKRK